MWTGDVWEISHPGSSVFPETEFYENLSCSFYVTRPNEQFENFVFAYLRIKSADCDEINYNF